MSCCPTSIAPHGFCPWRRRQSATDGSKSTAVVLSPSAKLNGRTATAIRDPTEVGPRTVILPGLVNAHTHLELSWMRGRVPPGDVMPAWAARLIASSRRIRAVRSGAGRAGASRMQRRCGRDCGGASERDGAGRRRDQYARRRARPLAESGVVGGGLLRARGLPHGRSRARVAGASQRLASLPQHDCLRAAIAPHAPYSVRRSLSRDRPGAGEAVRSACISASRRKKCVFCATAPARGETCSSGFGAWIADWTPPACGPVDYVDRLGLLNDRLIAVHGVQFEDAELRSLAACGATVVDLSAQQPLDRRRCAAARRRFYESGVRVAIGTDSLASVADLNMFNEMAEFAALAPDVPARQILESATLDGATALGLRRASCGSIAAGKRAELLAVRVPAGVEDVEEYLVRGNPADGHCVAEIRAEPRAR